ncbi:MAG: pentapeptide repeat-containing protein [Myxococcota bacterium]
MMRITTHIWRDLSGHDFSGQDLRRADFTGACLAQADLRGADLRGAFLRFADLEGACLDQADLREASLLGAWVRRASLKGAQGASLELTIHEFRAGWQQVVELAQGLEPGGGVTPADAVRHGSTLTRAELARLVALRLLNTGATEEGVALMRVVVQRWSDPVTARFLLRLLPPSEALDMLHTHAPRRPELFADAVGLHLAQGQLLEAVETIDTALKTQRAPRLIFHQGAALVEQARDLEGALQLLRAAQVTHPNDAPLLTTLAALTGRLGDTATALEALTPLAPSHPGAAVVAGGMMAGVGRASKALSFLSMVSDEVLTDDERAMAHLAQARSLCLLGRGAEALSVLERMVDPPPTLVTQARRLAYPEEARAAMQPRSEVQAFAQQVGALRGMLPRAAHPTTQENMAMFLYGDMRLVTGRDIHGPSLTIYGPQDARTVSPGDAWEHMADRDDDSTQWRLLKASSMATLKGPMEGVEEALAEQTATLSVDEHHPMMTQLAGELERVGPDALSAVLKDRIHDAIAHLGERFGLTQKALGTLPQGPIFDGYGFTTVVLVDEERFVLLPELPGLGLGPKVVNTLQLQVENRLDLAEAWNGRLVFNGPCPTQTPLEEGLALLLSLRSIALMARHTHDSTGEKLLGPAVEAVQAGTNAWSIDKP